MNRAWKGAQVSALTTEREREEQNSDNARNKKHYWGKKKRKKESEGVTRQTDSNKEIIDKPDQIDQIDQGQLLPEATTKAKAS